MLKKAIKSLFLLWTPLILSKFQLLWGKVPGKVFKLDETLAPPENADPFCHKCPQYPVLGILYNPHQCNSVSRAAVDDLTGFYQPRSVLYCRIVIMARTWIELDNLYGSFN